MSTFKKTQLSGKEWWASLNDDQKQQYREKKDVEAQLLSDIAILEKKYGFKINYTVGTKLNFKKRCENEDSSSSQPQKRSFKEWSNEEKQAWAEKKGFVWGENKSQQGVPSPSTKKKPDMDFETMYGISAASLVKNKILESDVNSD